MSQKELRVYVLSAENDFEVYADKLDSWSLCQEEHNTLPEEAKQYIDICETEGTVYSLRGFQMAVNMGEICYNDWIFITNLY